jgi:hypothetical protein
MEMEKIGFNPDAVHSQGTPAKGGCPPASTPTIDPSDVRILKAASVKSFFETASLTREETK